MKGTLWGIRLAMGLLGTALLLAGVILLSRTLLFVHSASTATGRVSEEIGGVGSGRFIVKFIDNRGEERQVETSVRSTPNRFAVGDRVRVLYTTQWPWRTQVDDANELWLGAGISSLMGMFFFLFGFGAMGLDAWRSRRRSRILATGKAVPGTGVRVLVDQTMSVNDQRPWVVLAEWFDASSNRVHAFRSERLWFDPSPYLQNRNEVTVYLDRGNPRHYAMDLRFLPQLVD